MGNVPHVSNPPPLVTAADRIRRHARLSLVVLAAAALVMVGLLLDAFGAGSLFWFGLVVLAGAAAGVVWSWRRLRPALDGLDHLERGLARVRLGGAPPQRWEAAGGPAVEGYNALLERLAQSEMARLGFLADAVHQLRAPLTAILSYAELLKDPAMHASPAETARWSENIIRGARQMDQLVDDLLTAAAVEGYPADLAPGPLRLESFLAAVVAEVRSQSGREITLEVAPDTLLARGDALYLRRVFLNLLQNSARFAPPDTPIRVGVGRSASDGRAEITVSDQGPGIAESDQALLFQRFGRVKSERARSLAGGSLGLYIAHRIMAHHEGDIRVLSQPERGLTFSVTLPLE